MGRKNWTDEKIIARLINNKSEEAKWNNITELRRRPSEELFNKCVEFTKSTDPKIRKIGINILSQLGLKERPFLKQSLTIYFDLLSTETEPETLMSLLFAIGHNNDDLTEEQIQKICSFGDCTNNLVKEGLVSALGFIEHLAAIKVLIKLSSDKSSGIRDWSTFYIAQGEMDNDDIREALWKRVKDRHDVTKFEAIVGLAKRRDNRVNELIKREIIEGQHGGLLFEAIIETKNEEFLPLLQQNLKSAEGDETINPKWKNDLENCIKELIKLTKV